MYSSDDLIHHAAVGRQHGATPPRALLVGNDRAALQAMAGDLAQAGLTAAVTTSAASALAQLERSRGIEAVVAELTLDGMGGLELLRKISGNRRLRRVRTILVAERTGVDHVLHALRLGAFDFLPRPVSAREIADAVERALGADASSAERAELTREDAARLLLGARRRRDAIFGSELFEDPAWNIMLDLYASTLRGRSVVVTDLCIASGASATTALRRIGTLAARGLIARIPDPSDRRRVRVVQT